MGQEQNGKWWRKTPKSIELGSYFEEDWEERHLEILFPLQHVSHLPWKPYDWDHEVPQSIFKNYEVTIKSLQHVTHKENFKKIKSSNPKSYTLKFYKKKGKSGYLGDGSPMGYTFRARDGANNPVNRKSKYKYIDSSSDLLPGSYSWWSLRMYPHQIKRNTASIKVSTPFSKPSWSPYGSIAIYGDIKYVFEHYQASLSRDPTQKLPKIELRNGGTTRYRHEVCHIVIVCAANEQTLQKYPIWQEGKIKFNGKRGAVSWVNPINVTIKNGMRKNNEGCYSWDHYVFAFHSPDDEHQMICPMDKFSHMSVKHHYKFCVKSKPLVKGERYHCPDEIAKMSFQKKRKRKQNSDSFEGERESKRRHFTDE